MRLPVPLCRLAYRVAWQGLRVWWMIAHPHIQGVKCVLTDGESVLLVRHTYGHRDWDLPGGKLERGERPSDGASREMREELGVAVSEWQPLGVVQRTSDGRHDVMHVFAADVGGQPLTVDACELAQVGWFAPGSLPTPLGRHVAEIVTRRP